MKISLACDHGGLELKNKIKEHLEARGCATSTSGLRLKICRPPFATLRRLMTASSAKSCPLPQNTEKPCFFTTIRI